MHAVSQADPTIADMTTANSTTVWLLQSKRLGDNQQVLALGAALEARFGWRLVVKELKFRGTAKLATTIENVDLPKSDPLVATPDSPWPDLVIAIGRHTVPVARWIKMQAMSAGKPAGIHVQLGRFSEPFDSVDLLVTTAQYGLPSAANVLQLTLPITARKKDVLAAAAAAFAPTFATVTGPLIGVLVGGPVNPINFGAADAKRLVREGLAYAAARQGTLLVATSPRTPVGVLDVLKRDLPAPHRLFAFEKGADARNPYPALLALADTFIVTSDSVSMMADAALTGREVRLFDLPVTPRRPLWQPSWPLANWVGRRRVGRQADNKPADWLDRWYDEEVRRARAQPTRYVPTIMNRLLRERHVTLLSSGVAPQLGLDQLAAEELDMVVARIVALMAERRAAALRTQLAGGGLAARIAPSAEERVPQISSPDPAFP